jgi:hypothetical protein
MAEVSERRDREVAPLVSENAVDLPRGLAQWGPRVAMAWRSLALTGVVLRRTPSAVRRWWAALRTGSLDLLPSRSELLSGWAMSKPRLALNLVMAGLSVFFSIRVGHALLAPDPQISSRIPRPIAATAPRHQDVAPRSRSRGADDVITTRNLFNPHRSESTPSPAIILVPPVAATWALYGVVISDDTRLAYVQDLATKRIFGYKTGDKLAGGQVGRIEPDRVVILRSGGPVELMLHRPEEPRPGVSKSPSASAANAQPSPPAVPSPDEGSPRRFRGRQE